MVNLLSKYDSDKNNKLIKEIIGKAIQNKQKELDKIRKEIESVEKQQKDGHYFMPLNKDPTVSAQYVGQAIISILGAIIDGIGEATEHIKSETLKISQEQNKQVGGSKGASTGGNAKAEEVTKLADNLTKLIRQSKEIIHNINKSSKLNSSSESGIMGSGLSEAMRMGKIAFFTGLKMTESMVNNILNFVLDSTGNEDIINKPWQELSPELNKKLILLAGVLKEMSENPATKEAIKEAAKTIAVNTVELMEVIEPDINKVTDQAVHMINDVASKSAHGMASTGVSVAQAFIAEIPVVGGILDLMIAIGKGFNALMKVFKVFVSNFSDITVQGAETVAKVKDKVDEIKASDKMDNNVKNNTNHTDTIKRGFGSAMAKAKSGADFAKQKAKDVANSDAAKSAVASAKSGAEFAKQKAKDVANSDAVQNIIQSNPSNPWIKKAKLNGEPYWLNTLTKEVSDTDPQNIIQSNPSNPWIKKAKLNGEPYWYNNLTKEVRETDPQLETTTAIKGGKSTNKYIKKKDENKTISTRKLRSHIARSNKRLRKTIKLFHSTLPKMKYKDVSNKNKKY